MSEIVNCRGKANDGSIIIDITSENGKKERHYYRGVRCGLSWPSAISPGYYCLVGQLMKPVPSGKYPLRLLKEGEAKTPGELFLKLFDEAGIFSCWEIYSDVSEKYRNYAAAFMLYRRENRGLQNIRLKLAPYYQSFPHGIALIREWVENNALHIPRDASIHNQLRSITGDDLTEDAPEKFYAINGLRYVMGAFDTTLCLPPMGIKQIMPVSIEAWS
jgi:hypothetical protein